MGLQGAQLLPAEGMELGALVQASSLTSWDAQGAALGTAVFQCPTAHCWLFGRCTRHQNVPPDLFFSLKGLFSHLYVEVPKQCCWQHSECSLAPGSPYFREMLGSLPGLCPVAAQLGACVLEHPDSCRNGVLHEAGTKVPSALLPPDCRLRLFMAQNSSGAGPCLLAQAHISLG